MDGGAASAVPTPPATAEGAVVAIVSVEVTLDPDGVTEDGEREQLAPEGAPAQVSAMAELNPPEGVSVMV